MQPPLQLANRKPRRAAKIALTPLIDVVFILLVFFMLASSLLDWRAINMNAPGKAAVRPAMDGALLVDISAGDLRLSGETIDLDDLAAVVSRRVAENPAQRVIVRVEPGIILQEAVDVLDRLSAAGAMSLSMIRGSGG